MLPVSLRWYIWQMQTNDARNLIAFVGKPKLIKKTNGWYLRKKLEIDSDNNINFTLASI